MVGRGDRLKILPNITLIYKKGECDQPANFRMIALGSTCAKLFHQILVQRFVHYLIANKFIDKTIQKAFINKINGTIEHNQLLLEMMQHAKANRKTLHLTFFDLEDAFGSVQHQLIMHGFQRFDIPVPIQNYIKELYDNISGKVVTKDWTSSEFKFKKGVYQGDPLSPIIFLMSFNPILEKLSSYKERGYCLNDHNIITTPFADDFNLCTTNRRTHQKLINEISEWTKSMKLKLKPVKCKSFSIVSGKSTPISFTLDGIAMDTIEKEPHKFLGSQITSGKQEETYQHVHKHFLSRLEKIDALLLRGEYKVRILKDYLLPACRFILTVHELTSTNIDKLDALVNRHIKKWIGMPQCATPGILHIPLFLDIPSVRSLYLQSHATAHASSRLKADSTVNAALDSKINRETSWSRKFSTAVYCENKFNEAKETAEENQNQILSVKKKITKTIKQEIIDKWVDHIKTLVSQGHFLRLEQVEMSDTTWKSYIFNMPRNTVKFLLNSVIDTLPTNSNLFKWGKRSNSLCEICSQHETLLHTLNNCQKMLDRYLWRHNSVLNQMYTLASDHAETNWEIFADMYDAKQGISTIPTDIVITNQIPDLVLDNKTKKLITIVELTVCFESEIVNAATRKQNRYASLITDIEQSDFTPSLYTIEIGSRGLVSMENQTRLKEIYSQLNVKQKDIVKMKNQLSKTALLGSYTIFYSKFISEWINPPLIKL